MLITFKIIDHPDGYLQLPDLNALYVWCVSNGMEIIVKRFEYC